MRNESKITREAFKSNEKVVGTKNGHRRDNCGGNVPDL